MWLYTLLFALQIFSFISTVSGAFNVTAELHHPVTLPCDSKCPGSLRWRNVFQKVVSQCDQSSCRPEKGFNISHDQYLKGKPYLTITAADYSNRGKYTCQCEDRDVCNVRLLIKITEMRPQEIIPGEPIDLHLPLTDLVEVSFTPSDPEQSSSDLQICTVDNEKIHCSPDYGERTSRLNTLQIKDGHASDSGRYTVRDLVNDETLATVQVHVEDVAKSSTRARPRRSLSEPCSDSKQERDVVPIVLLVLVGAAFLILLVMYWRLRRENQLLRNGS